MRIKPKARSDEGQVPRVSLLFDLKDWRQRSRVEIGKSAAASSYKENCGTVIWIQRQAMIPRVVCVFR